MAEPRGRQRSIINLIFEISRVFRALWGPFVSGSDINLSDNVLGNAVSEAESHIAFADTRFNGKNAEKNAEIIGPHSRIKMARDYILFIFCILREQYKYIVSLIFDSLSPVSFVSPPAKTSL